MDKHDLDRITRIRKAMDRQIAISYEKEDLETTKDLVEANEWLTKLIGTYLKNGEKRG